MVETPGFRPARLSSALSDAVFLASLLLRPFETADRVDPLADRTVDRQDRAAPDIGMTRRGTGTQRLPPPQFLGLEKAAGERATDFLVPLTRKRVPQAFPLVLAEPPDLFQDRVERVVGISGFVRGRLSARCDRGAHARGTPVPDRGNRSGLLLRRQRRERIEFNPVVGDLRNIAQRLAHRRRDAVDTLNRARSIGSRDAEFTGGGTHTAFASASAPSGNQLGNWSNLVQFVIGLIAGLAGPALAPRLDPLAGVLGPLQCGQFGAVQILGDFPEASLELRTRLRHNRDLVDPELDAGRQAMTTRNHRPTLRARTNRNRRLQSDPGNRFL